MARGKCLSVYFMDGIADGRIHVNIQNWNGEAYKIPRDYFVDKTGVDIEALSRSGIYLLFGDKNVYIGQAEIRKNGQGILQRVVEHMTDNYKDFWDEAVVFTTKDASLGKTELSYLENRFYNKTKEAGSYVVQNSNEPARGTVTLPTKDSLEDYLDQAELVLGALGYKLFKKGKTPIVTIPQNNQPKVQKELPPLPDKSLKIGVYVKTAMKNLSESGYRFSDESINAMCSSEWSIEHFHTKHPFMKRCIGENTSRKEAGQVRFWAEEFMFGDTKVLVTKEWYSRQFSLFDEWYNSLGELTKQG